MIVDGGWFINFWESFVLKVIFEFFNMLKLMISVCVDFFNGYLCCLLVLCMLV